MDLHVGQSHLNPWEDDGGTNPEKHFQRCEGQKMIRIVQQEFTNGKLCLTNLIVFSNRDDCLHG